MRTTMPEMYWHLMDGPSIGGINCAVCGRFSPLNDHHVVFRSQGKLFRDGKEVPKPTIRLCGNGNHLRDANGREYCHGKAHHGLLHFDFRDGAWWVLETDEPCKAQEAWAMEGWLKLDDFYRHEKIIDHYAALREATFERGIYYDDWEDE